MEIKKNCKIHKQQQVCLTGPVSDWTGIWLDRYLTGPVSDWTGIWLDRYLTGPVSDWTCVWLDPYLTGPVSDWTRVWLARYLTGPVSDWTGIWLDRYLTGPVSEDTSVLIWGLCHLQLLQHGRLVCKAQVAAANTELLGEVVEVHLKKNREDYGTWEEQRGSLELLTGSDNKLHWNSVTSPCKDYGRSQ